MRNRLIVLFVLAVAMFLSAPAAQAQYAPNVMLDWQNDMMGFVAQARDNMHYWNGVAQNQNAQYYNNYGQNYGQGGGYYGGYQQGYGQGYGNNGYYGMPQYSGGYRGGYGQGGGYYGRGGYGQGYGQMGGYRPFVRGRGRARATQDTVNAWGIANTAVGVGNLVLGFANRSKLNNIEHKVDQQNSYQARVAEAETSRHTGLAQTEEPREESRPAKVVEIWTNHTGCEVSVKDWDDADWHPLKDGDSGRLEYGPLAQCRVAKSGYECAWAQTGPDRKDIYAKKAR